MINKFIAGIVFLFCLFFSFAVADAYNMKVIGTANFDANGNGAIEVGESYKLIWDDDNNGKSIVWLDYSNYRADFSTQKSWASGLNGNIIYNIDSTKYLVDWGSNSWRLPVIADGPGLLVYADLYGSPNLGYNITSSEMGHLYYDELGNIGSVNEDGSSNPFPGLPEAYLGNTGDFDNLTNEFYYWTGSNFIVTHFVHLGNDYAFCYYMNGGRQNFQYEGVSLGYGIALSEAQVTDLSQVPILGSLLLLGSGIISLIPLIRKKYF